MQVVRSALFTVFLYLSIVVAGLLYTPFLLGPRRFANRLIALWARVAAWGFRTLCGVTIEVRGVEKLPKGAALIAAKHQGMLDIIVPFFILEDPCFVLKKELMVLPFLGWMAWKARMIPVDRGAHARALKKLVADSRDRLKEARQLVIFPEGTRTEPGAPGEYKPGVAALYRDLEVVPCWPIATNSGQCWPAHGFMKHPGKVVFEVLDPIPAGLKRGQFMSELETRIETASTALLTVNRP